MVVVPNVVDTEVVPAGAGGRGPQPAHEPPRLLSVGALAAKKGHRDLLSALGGQRCAAPPAARAHRRRTGAARARGPGRARGTRRSLPRRAPEGRGRRADARGRPVRAPEPPREPPVRAASRRRPAGCRRSPPRWAAWPRLIGARRRTALPAARSRRPGRGDRRDARRPSRPRSGPDACRRRRPLRLRGRSPRAGASSTGSSVSAAPGVGGLARAVLEPEHVVAEHEVGRLGDVDPSVPRRNSPAKVNSQPARALLPHPVVVVEPVQVEPLPGGGQLLDRLADRCSPALPRRSPPRSAAGSVRARRSSRTRRRAIGMRPAPPRSSAWRNSSTTCEDAGRVAVYGWTAATSNRSGRARWRSRIGERTQDWFGRPPSTTGRPGSARLIASWAALSSAT